VQGQSPSAPWVQIEAPATSVLALKKLNPLPAGLPGRPCEHYSYRWFIFEPGGFVFEPRGFIFEPLAQTQIQSASTVRCQLGDLSRRRCPIRQGRRNQVDENCPFFAFTSPSSIPSENGNWCAKQMPALQLRSSSIRAWHLCCSRARASRANQRRVQSATVLWQPADCSLLRVTGIKTATSIADYQWTEIAETGMSECGLGWSAVSITTCRRK
jgi:hypothetical protein